MYARLLINCVCCIFCQCLNMIVVAFGHTHEGLTILAAPVRARIVATVANSLATLRACTALLAMLQEMQGVALTLWNCRAHFTTGVAADNVTGQANVLSTVGVDRPLPMQLASSMGSRPVRYRHPQPLARSLARSLSLMHSSSVADHTTMRHTLDSLA